MDQAAATWETMLIDAHGTAPEDSRRSTLRSPMVVAVRTTVLLILASLAILVLLPAALTAQAAFTG